MATTNTATRGGKKVSFMDELMSEPIRLPGCPQVIVTRAWAYSWLKSLGYKLQGGYNSVDYMVFRQSVVNEPLSDVTAPWFVSLIARMEADCR